MNYKLLLILILFAGMIITAGCLSNQTGKSSAPIIIQTQAPVTQPSPSSGPTIQAQITPVTPPDKTLPPAPGPRETDIPGKKIERVSDMETFISDSFPDVTGIYSEIKKSKNALEWKMVQDQSLQLQILVQDLKKTYQLNTPNPEQNVFPGLDNRQEIVFLKYVRYLDDMENYATNLKNAVYYQEKGSDPESAQTSRRYQGLADQFEKQAISEVKTISDYCTDFKYSFFDQEVANQYRYTG